MSGGKEDQAQRAARAADELQLGSRWVDEGLVFARGSTGWPATRLPVDRSTRGVSRLLKARVARHGLPEVRFRDLRRTWATPALKAGVPAKVARERLDHANPSITMEHPQPGSARNAG